MILTPVSELTESFDGVTLVYLQSSDVLNVVTCCGLFSWQCGLHIYDHHREEMSLFLNWGLHFILWNTNSLFHVCTCISGTVSQLEIAIVVMWNSLPLPISVKQSVVAIDMCVLSAHLFLYKHIPLGSHIQWVCMHACKGDLCINVNSYLSHRHNSCPLCFIPADSYTLVLSIRENWFAIFLELPSSVCLVETLVHEHRVQLGNTWL